MLEHFEAIEIQGLQSRHNYHTQYVQYVSWILYRTNGSRPGTSHIISTYTMWNWFYWVHRCTFWAFEGMQIQWPQTGYQSHSQYVQYVYCIWLGSLMYLLSISKVYSSNSNRVVPVTYSVRTVCEVDFIGFTDVPPEHFEGMQIQWKQVLDNSYIQYV